MLIVTYIFNLVVSSYNGERSNTNLIHVIKKTKKQARKMTQYYMLGL